MRKTKITIIGTNGIPASYGGFETLADNLVRYAYVEKLPTEMSVYCSGKCSVSSTYCGAELRYVPLKANGVSSILYDVVSLFSAVRNGDDVVLLLGVSGAIALPIIRLISRVQIVTNIDGIEWKREKWNRFARAFLRISEYIAIKYSHRVVSDNKGIAEHVKQEYRSDSFVIAYGGDHAIRDKSKPNSLKLPKEFALSLCRIEPENNVEMILKSFSQCIDKELVFIGNWGSSEFGRMMHKKYVSFENLHLLAPIYDIQNII